MTSIPLPQRSVSFSPEGFKEIYKMMCSDPAVAKAVADALEEDPRRVLEHIFRLTEEQKEAVAAKKPDALRKSAKNLVIQLRSDSPEPLSFHPSAIEKGGPNDPPPDTGSCHFDNDPTEPYPAKPK